jgi:hypothetical protein
MKNKFILKDPEESVEFFLISQNFSKIQQDAHILDFYARDEEGEQLEEGNEVELFVDKNISKQINNLVN